MNAILIVGKNKRREYIAQFSRNTFDIGQLLLPQVAFFSRCCSCTFIIKRRIKTKTLRCVSFMYVEKCRFVVWQSIKINRNVQECREDEKPFGKCRAFRVCIDSSGVFGGRI